MTTSLSEQALAVERMAANQRGFCEVLTELVAKRKRPAADAEQQYAWLPALEDAARTMRALAEGNMLIRLPHTNDETY
jgi:predicted CopG family antitoxin